MFWSSPVLLHRRRRVLWLHLGCFALPLLLLHRGCLVPWLHWRCLMRLLQLWTLVLLLHGRCLALLL